MRRSFLPALATSAVLLSSSALYGANFSFNSVAVDGSRYAPIINAAGDAVAAGSGFAAVGMFASDPAGRGIDAQLLSEFTAYASGSFGVDPGFGDPLPGSVGLAGGDVIDDAFNDETIYLVFGNGADLLSSDEFAIIDTGDTFFDDDPNAPAPMAFDVDLNAALANGTIDFGAPTQQGVPAVDALGVPNGGGIQLAVVPEPGAATLSLLGLLMVAARRRR